VYLSRELRGPSAEQGGARPIREPQSSSTAGALLVRPARGFVRFLYSSNPFYILSADLVFVGLRISFGSSGPVSNTWALWFCLAGYTLLLATTACFLIRKGKLWDDLRSLLLLIVMMFVAMAASGDDTMAADPQRGAFRYLAGFIFAVVVTESVLRGIRLRLPAWYRAAYYAILGLVFLYPIALTPALGAPESSLLQWALFGFSPLAGLAILLLLPAAGCGPGYVTSNGSPWRWPLYPWSLFFVLACGVGIRCYSLCVSFHFVNGSQTIFGPYFLVPIGLALSLVWLEIGIAAGRQGVMIAASAMPLFLALLATTGHRYEPIYMNFLDMFRQTLGGSPVFLTLIAAGIFLAYAVARRVPLACELLSVALVALATVGPQTLDLNQLVAPRPAPLAAAGFVLGSIAWKKRHSIRGTLAALLFVIAATRGWMAVWPTADWGVVALHLLIIGMLAIGAFFDDCLSDLAQSCASLALLVLGIASALHVPLLARSLPANLAPWYPLFVMVATVAYGLLVRDRIYLAIAGASLAAWVGYSTLQSYQQLRRIVAGLDQIVGGLLFFLIAAAISLKKAGLWPRSIFRSIARLLRAE
jgi:hypothetical protein